MNYFTQDDMEMLCQMGYSATYVEDLEDGDEIAFALGSFLNSELKTIEFSRVTQLRKIPRYAQDMYGRIIDPTPNYLVQWIAMFDNGVTKPMQYGAGWACYRKERVVSGQGLAEG
jgi:hypothetical protein